MTTQDGPEKEDVELNLGVLRLGGVLYSPVFENLSFRLSLAISARRKVSGQAQLV